MTKQELDVILVPIFAEMFSIKSRIAKTEDQEVIIAMFIDEMASFLDEFDQEYLDLIQEAMYQQEKNETQA